MKKYFGISVLVFLLLCSNSSADILDDLRSFEKSLSKWVNIIDKLDERLLKLEDNLGAQSKEQEDFKNDLNARIEEVENKTSETGIGKVLKTYEKTMDIFKKRLSRMAKRVEDTEVKTAVLEKIYHTSQKPLETLMETLDEQNKIIDNLSKKVNLQGKTILAMKDDFKKQPALSDESLTKSIEELNKKIADLETKTVVISKVGKEFEKEDYAKIGKVEKERKREKKVVVASKEVPDQKTELFTEKPPEITEPGFIDIGKGFFVKDIMFKPFGSSTLIKGEIKNKTERDHGRADFKIYIYDNANNLLGKHRFSVNSFKKDIIKKFEEIIVGVKPKNIAKYAILFVESAVLTAAPGEEVLKIIERKKAIVSVQKIKSVEKSKEVLTESEEAILAEGLEIEEPKNLEGFEDVGNGFYAGKVSFKSFGSSTTVKGEILNTSEKDYYKASFIMKIYSKNYGMITKFDFSVRRLKSGETKSFEEIITGIQPVDIARYEIVFKKSY